MESIESLVRRSKGGDVAAFEEIVRRFSRRAVATAHLVCGDLHIGEEAAQDAFVTAWRKLSSLREPAAFPGWFGAILSRTAIRKRRPPPIPLPDDGGPEIPAAGLPDEEALPREVKGLKPMYREVLALRYVEGLSYREIAAALGIGVARVKSRLHDARQLLKERLARRRHGRT